jgi:subfamily B ATP-binding cassette protein MsbA
MMALSLVAGASLGSVIFTAGTAVSILFGGDEDFSRQSDRLVGQVRTVSEKAHRVIGATPPPMAERLLGWAPKDTVERARKLLLDMRQNRHRALQIIAGAIVVFTLLNGIARYVLEYFAAALGLNVSIRLNREMFDNLLNLSSRFYDRRTAGELVSRFTNDSFMVNSGLADVFTRALREPARMVFMLILAMWVDVYLTLIFMTVISPLVFIIMLIGKRVKTAVHRSLDRVASMASLLNEAVRGMAIIKIFRMEGYERRRMDRELNGLRRQRKRIARANAAVAPVTEIVIVFALGAFLLAAEQRVSKGLLQASDILMLLVALAGMLEPMRLLSKVPNLVQTSAASAARVFEFIDYQPDVAERAGARDMGALREAIRFEDVHFAYVPGQDVLNGATFEVPRGKMVALVGFSGAGKSTLVKLLPRFYDVESGRITIDGVDIRDATFASLRGQIGMVTQETMLFSESIRTNIAAGAEAPAEDRVRTAARAAHADGFIEALPCGYDAVLAEAGGNLSGGQRQRVAIGRAIFKDAPILILDEATSSLDSESEKAILDALDHFVQGRTTLVIAHRLSTILKADKIVVLDGGRVVDEGTHAELIARDGLYRRLYRLQFAADTEPVREADAK